MKRILFFLSICIFSFSHSQEKAFEASNISINGFIDGTLLLPKHIETPNLTILIGGSGPTDRDGNQKFLKNNSLKKLAETLSSNGIATFRYDKRIVKQIRNGNVDKNMLFDDFVTDAILVIAYFKATKAYSKIFVAGHSQGSLVGILAVKGRADAFISLAGAGQPIDAVIQEQIEKTAPMFAEDSKRVLAILKAGKTTNDYPIALESIFNKDLQPFMSSWMRYNPQDEIKKLTIPVLIINGTKDLQVSPTEADLLNKAVKNPTYKIIENMNHLLVPITGDDLENSKSYNNPSLKLSQELIDSLLAFIK